MSHFNGPPHRSSRGHTIDEPETMKKNETLVEKKRKNGKSGTKEHNELRRKMERNKGKRGKEKEKNARNVSANLLPHGFDKSEKQGTAPLRHRPSEKNTHMYA